MNSTSVIKPMGTLLVLILALVGCASMEEKGAPLTVDFDLHARAVYTMEHIEGNTLKDDSGNGLDAIIRGNPATTEGKFGKALVFDGTQTYIELKPEVLEGKEWSFLAWVNAEAWPPWARIFDFGDGATADMWFGFSGVEGVMRCDIFHPSGSVKLLGPAFPTGEWVHLAITVNGREMVMYVDGKRMASGYTGLLPSHVEKKRLYIGASNWPDPLFVGKMDEILIADAAYTDQQIKAIMQSGIPVR
ncbi:LamG domain-containing protein [Spirochaeta thermophila]|uniref:Putative transmembrane protein n=1 Tax=Winmispira thermophila (strain ATCC 49972 / DSM 6192 / RI 19.B1) TaxID=665571 RepID=E0RTN7_WINT6|nr:LamG domain-containing protein [Spirochaeta thermophila]ADN02412.1 putative transmembrane protein [Spirochaeta thermophila DSM 6192]